MVGHLAMGKPLRRLPAPMSVAAMLKDSVNEMECEYKARLANEQYFYSQRSLFPFGPGPQSPADHARALHGISTINAMRDSTDPRTVPLEGMLQPRSIRVSHPSS